jgi:hypothetical protein
VGIGYWWNIYMFSQRGATLKPRVWLLRSIARAFPIQSALMQELLGHFHCDQRLWFLSDGGHFEKTGCYELLRHRVPLIVICDDGADPKYTFEDCANLVRKARLDFGVENRRHSAAGARRFRNTGGCAPESAADRGGFGRRADRSRGVVVNLLLAKVTHPKLSEGDERHSLLVIVKPSTTGDEPLDVLQCAASHPTFRQETTADQFVDGAQGESYRRAGQHFGQQVRALTFDDLFDSLNAETPGRKPSG